MDNGMNAREAVNGRGGVSNNENEYSSALREVSAAMPSASGSADEEIRLFPGEEKGYRTVQRTDSGFGANETRMNGADQQFKNPYAYDGATLAYQTKPGKPVRRTGRTILLSILVTVLIAAIGMVAYSLLHKYSITIYLASSHPVREARFGDMVLPYTVPDQNGNAVYSFEAKSGEYVFYAKNDAGMRSDDYVFSVSADATFEAVIPTPSPTPLPRIEAAPGQWLIQAEDKTVLLADSKTGQISTIEGVPSEDIKWVCISVTVDSDTFSNDKDERLFIRNGEAKQNLLHNGESADITVSEGEYDLYLNDGRNDLFLMKLDQQSGYAASLDMNAIRFYLDHLKDDSENDVVYFVADECNRSDFVTDSDELNGWAERYPSLFERVKQHDLKLELDEKLENVDVTINGKVWKTGDNVTVSDNVTELQVAISLNQSVYNECIPVSADIDSIVIGSKISEEKLDENWKTAKRVIDTGDEYVLFLEDGSCVTVNDKERFDEALEWFIMEFKFGNEISEKVPVAFTLDPKVVREFIDSVTLDGAEIKENEIGEYAAMVTPGTYELAVVFSNGLEPYRMDVNTDSIPSQKLLSDRRMELTKLKKTLQAENVTGAVQIDGKYYYMPYRANETITDVDAETCLKYMQVFDSVLSDEVWEFVPVDIYVHMDIAGDKIAGIRVQDIPLPKMETDNGSYAHINAMILDDYEVIVELEGADEPVKEFMNAEQNADTESGVNEWHLLGSFAGEKLETLEFWGTERENIGLLDGDAEYLTPDSVQREKDAANLKKLTVKGILRNRWMNQHKFVVKYADSSADNGNAALEPVITQNNEFTVYMTGGRYELRLIEKDGDREYVLVDSFEMDEDRQIILKNGDYPEEMVEALATPTPEPTVTPKPVVKPTKKPATPKPTAKPVPTLEPGLSETLDCSIRGHELKNHEARQATCTDIGWNAYETCSRCSYTTYMEIPALGHHFSERMEIPATCTEDGSSESICIRCSYTRREKIPALGHEMVVLDSRPETCTENGWIHMICFRCSYMDYMELPSLGHYEIVEIQWDATCTDYGLIIERCVLCDSYSEIRIQPYGHRFDESNRCTICGEMKS